MTGVPSAIASTGTSQKSSSGGKRNARADAMSASFSSLETRNFHSIFGPDRARNARKSSVSVAVQRMSFFPFL